MRDANDPLSADALDRDARSSRSKTFTSTSRRKAVRYAPSKALPTPCKSRRDRRHRRRERFRQVGVGARGHAAAAAEHVTDHPGPHHVPGPQPARELDDEAMRKVRGRDVAMIFQEPMTSLNPVLSIGLQLMEPLFIHLNMSAAQAKRAPERSNC